MLIILLNIIYRSLVLNVKVRVILQETMHQNRIPQPFIVCKILVISLVNPVLYIKVNRSLITLKVYQTSITSKMNYPLFHQFVVPVLFKCSVFSNHPIQVLLNLEY